MTKPLGIVQAVPAPSNVGPAQLASASARQIAQSISALGSIPIVGKGNYFYFDTLSAPLQARPYVEGTPGLANTYSQGTGLSVKPGTFDTVELINPNNYPVVYSLRVGFGDFIDNRSILGGGAALPVVNPTYKTPGGSEATIPITDVSGQSFTDINGTLWLAVNRIAILATNYAASTDYIIQAAGSLVNNGPGICAVLARTSIYLPVSGNYSMSNGGGVNNLTISEIYNAILPSFQ